MALLPSFTNAIIPQCKPSKKLGLDPANSLPVNRATPAAVQRTNTASLNWLAPYTLEAIDTLVELMRDGKDERVRGTAAQALLDRGWGKAKVEVVTGLRAAIWTS